MQAAVLVGELEVGDRRPRVEVLAHAPSVRLVCRAVPGRRVPVTGRRPGSARPVADGGEQVIVRGRLELLAGARRARCTRSLGALPPHPGTAPPGGSNAGRVFGRPPTRPRVPQAPSRSSARSQSDCHRRSAYIAVTAVDARGGVGGDVRRTTAAPPSARTAASPAIVTRDARRFGRLRARTASRMLARSRLAWRRAAPARCARARRARRPRGRARAPRRRRRSAARTPASHGVDPAQQPRPRGHDLVSAGGRRAVELGLPQLVLQPPRQVLHAAARARRYGRHRARAASRPTGRALAARAAATR